MKRICLDDRALDEFSLTFWTVNVGSSDEVFLCLTGLTRVSGDCSWSDRSFIGLMMFQTINVTSKKYLDVFYSFLRVCLRVSKL